MEDSSDLDPARIQPVESTAGRPTLPSSAGQYSIRREIASGGMGTVYEAFQEEPRRVVAIKVMRAGTNSEESLRRFRFEAQLLARSR